MKIGYISDLHAEHYYERVPYDPTPICDDLDIIVLAGDICNQNTETLMCLQGIYPNIPILYVLGNHEYYHIDISKSGLIYNPMHLMYRNIVLLDNTAHISNGVRFLGTTLWSNLSDKHDAANVQAHMYDLKLIFNNSKVLSAKKYTELWQKNVKWLEEILSQPFDGKTVVISHHSPSPITCAPEHQSSNIRHGFHSDLNWLIEKYKPALWIYGHDHISAIHKVGETLLVSNQYGYPHESNYSLVTLEVIEI
jgi:Icc-related predicted phosphoesterase